MVVRVLLHVWVDTQKARVPTEEGQRTLEGTSFALPQYRCISLITTNPQGSSKKSISRSRICLVAQKPVFTRQIRDLEIDFLLEP